MNHLRALTESCDGVESSILLCGAREKPMQANEQNEFQSGLTGSSFSAVPVLYLFLPLRAAGSTRERTAVRRPNYHELACSQVPPRPRPPPRPIVRPIIYQNMD